ncbi:MerR family transcriptional regulator [Dissulfurirhabdus thermomarina]|uniref:MerR family transcriptional regulator n=1 Tax=Dissulfurirhabdus thermomarina TaxID=1765737 RepID=UPI002852E9F5|nr:MerR family transcriptional regulator [Dissulfurirhabdus thermomarina]
MSQALDNAKKYYRIGEVSRMTGVAPHVLRYWEGEFHQIRPRRVARRRLYRNEDIRLVFRIKQLLYEEGLTISGARRRLREEAAAEAAPEQAPAGRFIEALREIRSALQDLRDSLAAGDEKTPGARGPSWPRE